MVLSAKLELRHSQNLVMTPQLQQAIKLLQLSNIELGNCVETELERNPLLERIEGDAPRQASDDAPNGEAQQSSSELQATDDWLTRSDNMETKDPTGGMDVEAESMFPESNDAATGQKEEAKNLQDANWSSLGSGGSGARSDEAPNLEAYVADSITLQDYLTEQLALAITDPVMRLIGQHLIDMVDDAGYLRGKLENLAERLGAPLPLIEQTLEIVQKFEPAGVFARDLGECLKLQLVEQNRYDPAIAILLDNLNLLATHNLAALKKLIPDSDELADMIAEIKMLDPKPGLRFGNITVQPVVPDVLVRQQRDGSWHVELNSETLPKVLVNETYYTTVSGTARSDNEKSYINECMQTANWLVKSLDHRARTILKVAEEIVKQQDGFLTHGAQHLKPLNLKTVADAISMHESTVSRVTSNKYMSTNRGIFELKYFFTSSIASSGSGEAHSSEAVRYRIKQLIDHETVDKILSDDKIVDKLKDEGIDIARRTVAKYREAMRIPSSVQRRREKKMKQNAE